MPLKSINYDKEIFLLIISILTLGNYFRIILEYILQIKSDRWIPSSVMAKVLDCGLTISEFELQLYYYTHLQTNTLVKGMNSFILQAMG